MCVPSFGTLFRSLSMSFFLYVYLSLSLPRSPLLVAIGSYESSRCRLIIRFLSGPLAVASSVMRAHLAVSGIIIMSQSICTSWPVRLDASVRFKVLGVLKVVM